MRELLFLILAVLVLTSCGVTDPDNYGKKWENTFVWFNPNNLSSLYVSKTGDIKEAYMIPNDTDFLISWNHCSNLYSLSIQSYFSPIDFAYFDGFKAVDIEDEIPWQIEEGVYSLQSNKLLPPVNSWYRIMLTEKLD